MNRRLAQGYSGRRTATVAEPVTAVVALGANLGDRRATLASAVEELRRLPLTDLVVAAEPIETVALTVDGPDLDAPAYLNSVALVTTRLAPRILLGYLHAIERRHGRPDREPGQPRWQDRTLDLDLITYGDITCESAELTLPHPRAHERDFVLAPWLSVDADAWLPGAGRVDELLPTLREEAP